MVWELLGRHVAAVGDAVQRPLAPAEPGRLLSEPAEALDAVLAKATSIDPDVRFESMAELIIAWRDAVGRPEGVLSPMGSPSSSSLGSSRRRAVFALSTTVSAAVNPYKGLRPFSEADAADFFGRDDVATALLQTLTRARLRRGRRAVRVRQELAGPRRPRTTASQRRRTRGDDGPRRSTDLCVAAGTSPSRRRPTATPTIRSSGSERLPLRAPGRWSSSSINSRSVGHWPTTASGSVSSAPSSLPAVSGFVA